MGEIKVQVTASSPKSVNVGLKNVKTPVQVEENPTHYYSTLAKQWATQTNGLVQNEDYSAKYWANQAKAQADISQASAETAGELSNLLNENYTSYDNQLKELSSATVLDITSLKQASISEIEQEHNNALSEISEGKKQALEEISSAGAGVSTNEFNNFKNDVNLTLDNVTTNLDYKANTDLSNLSPAGEKHFLNKAQISNCVLEVPQRIKLEISDGTLRLKAGAVCIFPNGFEADGITPKFDYLTVPNDVLSAKPQYNRTNGIIYIDRNFSTFGDYPSAYSGDTAPTSTRYMLWYDTKTNIVKKSNDSGATWTSNYSLPLGLVNCGPNGYTEITQVFNGMGYIDKIIWADKGIKVLIPDGLNENGSYNNIEYTFSNILFYKETSPYTNKHLGLGFNFTQNRLFALIYWYTGTDFPPNVTASALYNPFSNQTKTISTDGGTISSTPCVLLCEFSRTNGKVSLEEELSGCALLTRNNFPEISDAGYPSSKFVDLSLGASETSYIAPANGKVYVEKQSTAANQFIAIISETLGIGKAIQYSAGPYNTIYIGAEVRAGEDFVISYNLGGSTVKFRFYYAEGEVK